MSDAKIRSLELAAATGDQQAERQLAVAKARAGQGERPVETMTPAEALFALISAGAEEGAARAQVLGAHGLDRLPRGCGSAIKRGLAERRTAAKREARKVPLTHRSAESATLAIERLLAAANGNRRTRTVDVDDCLRDLRDAASGAEFEDEGRSGGTVANSYGYASWRTVTTVVRIGQRVCVWIRRGSASKGSRSTPWARTGGASETEAMCHMAPTAPVVVSRSLARNLGRAE